MTNLREKSMDCIETRETSFAPPPPPAAERYEAPMFQTIDEMSVRHSASSGFRKHIYLYGGGILFGSLVFGLLYLVIALAE